VDAVIHAKSIDLHYSQLCEYNKTLRDKRLRLKTYPVLCRFFNGSTKLLVTLHCHHVRRHFPKQLKIAELKNYWQTSSTVTRRFCLRQPPALTVSLAIYLKDAWSTPPFTRTASGSSYSALQFSGLYTGENSDGNQQLCDYLQHLALIQGWKVLIATCNEPEFKYRAIYPLSAIA